MRLQKRKSAKYRRFPTKDEKKKKKDLLKNIKEKKIIENLYTLPLDIKIKIFQMIIMSNMNDWNINHMYCLRNSLLFIEDRDGFSVYGDNRYTKKYRYLNAESRWLYLNRDVPMYDKKTLCQKKVKEYYQDGIKSVFISNNMNELIDYRQWSNWSNQYWYHEKCRCKTCDLVRITGINYLSEKEQKRFSNIEWEPWSDQWKPKSNLQLRYEKHKEKKEKRTKS